MSWRPLYWVAVTLLLSVGALCAEGRPCPATAAAENGALPPAPRQGGDTCEAALNISGPLPISVAGTTVGYANDYDEVCPYFGSTAPDVVYVFTPIANLTVNITLCAGETDYDTKLYVYEETCPDAGGPVGCNDDACTSAAGQPNVSAINELSLTAGHSYYIVVDGYGTASGNYFLDICEEGAPPDYCPPEALFSQTRHEPDGDWAANTSDQGPPQNYRRFESYQATADIGGLRFWGLNLYKTIMGWSECSENPMPFQITFHADDGGQPGAEVCNYTCTLTGLDDPGLIYDGFQLYEYNASLQPPCTLRSGWVSIQGAGDPNCWFLWMSSPVGDGSSWVDDSGQLSQEDSDLAVCLTAGPCLGQTIGDANCDGAVNTFDIDAFVLAITDPVAWEAAYGPAGCDIICVCDCNGDYAVNTFDIDPFVDLLTGRK